MAPFRMDAQEDQREKMESYVEWIDGREDESFEVVSYEVTGAREDGHCAETLHCQITFDDGTVMYAICYLLMDDQADGMISYDMYTECPW